MNLEVKIGDLVLKNPVMTASGTFGYGPEFEPFIDINRLGELLKTKSVAKAVLSHIVEDDIPMLRQFVETYTGEAEMIIAEDNLVINL